MARPPRLTPERAKRFVESIEVGNTIRAAAETAHLGLRTVERYLHRGDQAEATVREALGALADPEAVDTWTDDELHSFSIEAIPEAERIYWEFWREVQRARAAAEERAVSSMREVGLGYDAAETVVEEKQVLDKNGDVVTLRSTRTITRFVRDWRAELAWLERARRDDWSPSSALAVTGADGGAVKVEGLGEKRERAAQVMDQVKAKREQKERAEIAAGRAYGPPVPFGIGDDVPADEAGSG